MPTLARALALLPLVSTFGCASQAQDDYRGEPLATIVGRVENPTAVSTDQDLVTSVI